MLWALARLLMVSTSSGSDGHGVAEVAGSLAGSAASASSARPRLRHAQAPARSACLPATEGTWPMSGASATAPRRVWRRRCTRRWLLRSRRASGGPCRSGTSVRNASYSMFRVSPPLARHLGEIVGGLAGAAAGGPPAPPGRVQLVADGVEEVSRRPGWHPSDAGRPRPWPDLGGEGFGAGVERPDLVAAPPRSSTAAAAATTATISSAPAADAARLRCRASHRRARHRHGSRQAETGSSAIHRSTSSARALGVGIAIARAHAPSP